MWFTTDPLYVQWTDEAETCHCNSSGLESEDWLPSSPENQNSTLGYFGRVAAIAIPPIFFLISLFGVLDCLAFLARWISRKRDAEKWKRFLKSRTRRPPRLSTIQIILNALNHFDNNGTSESDKSTARKATSTKATSSEMASSTSPSSSRVSSPETILSIETSRRRNVEKRKPSEVQDASSKSFHLKPCSTNISRNTTSENNDQSCLSNVDSYQRCFSSEDDEKLSIRSFCAALLQDIDGVDKSSD